MFKKIFLLLIQCSLVSLWAQELPLGQFKEFLPYNKFHWVAQDGENVYAATQQSILVVDKSNGSTDKWSKLNWLSEVGIQTLCTDQKGRLFVAYKNSNIDIVVDDKIHGIRDILNKQISGSKIINHIFSDNNLAYFSCDFGVVILELKSFLVKDSWFTTRQDESYRARFFTIHKERYYLATNKGVFSLPVSASNPADFSQWKLETELPNSSFKLLCSYQDKLFAVEESNSKKDSLFVYENSHWRFDDSINITFFRNFEVKNDKMLVCSWNHVKVFSGSEYKQYSWEPTPPSIWQNGYCATFDHKMDIWVADATSGLVHINTRSNTYDIITENGPANSGAYGLYFSDGVLAVVPGARKTALIPDYTAPAISLLHDENWWSYASFGKFKRANAFNSVVINPLNTNEIYMASWVGGLFKIDKTTNEISCYNRDNSILTVSPERLAQKDTSLFLSGLAIDKQNNLWMANSEVLDLLKVKDLKSKEEKWYSFNLSPYINKGGDVIAEHILIDSRSYKWITIPRQNKLIVFFENGPLGNNAVPRKAEVNLSLQANVASSMITCIAEDREGRIWLGTDQGIKVVFDAASVFNRPVIYAKNILLEQNGYVQNLLEFEHVTCIAVDAADRKWIGTRTAGVFLVSPTGTQELLHFTTENSPLFSNQIHDIKINPENGEVFFATEDGLISYKGTATAGRENYKEVLVYPNPVHEDYTGPIAVKGLMEDSFCKITDAAGKLVWQGYAYGGQLIWDGKDFNGKRPATGVYFVMASSKSGKEKKVAKFLFIQ